MDLLLSRNKEIVFETASPEDDLFSSQANLESIGK